MWLCWIQYSSFTNYLEYKYVFLVFLQFCLSFFCNVDPVKAFALMGEELRAFVKGKEIPEDNLIFHRVSIEDFGKGHILLHLLCFWCSSKKYFFKSLRGESSWVQGEIRVDGGKETFVLIFLITFWLNIFNSFF